MNPAAPAALTAEEITVRYGTFAAVDAVTLAIPSGEVTTLVGPNGCGKSTLIRTLAGLNRPNAGRVLMAGRPLRSLGTKDIARRIGFLPQNPTVPEHLSVRELVAHGRDPHRRWFDQWTAVDEAAVADALALTDLTHLARAAVDELSGGQRQRAWIALALAQDPDLLLLDEPTTHLDIAHQLDVLDLVRALVDERGTTVVMVLHDLTMAARFSDRIVAMHSGRIVAEGAPLEVMSPDTLEAVFEIHADIGVDPVSGRPVVLPLRRAAGARGADRLRP